VVLILIDGNGDVALREYARSNIRSPKNLGSSKYVQGGAKFLYIECDLFL
jgi:hypothetical protein